MLARKTLYVQIFENRVEARNVTESVSAIALANPPFSHPRALIGDFLAARACLLALLPKVMGPGLAIFRPFVLLHPREKLEGGLTPVEERVLLELGQLLRASKVSLYVGPELSDAEVAERVRSAR